MNHDVRLAALIARCAQQRLDAAEEVRALVAPVRSGIGLKVPLALAGVLLGMIATRAGRAMPIITAGLGVWKLVKNLLPMLRR